MTVRDLEVLYDYGYWANRRLLDAMAQLARHRRVGELPGRELKTGAEELAVRVVELLDQAFV